MSVSRTKRSLYNILSTSFPMLAIAIIGMIKVQVMLDVFGLEVSGFAFYVASLSAYLMLFEGGLPTIFAHYLYEPYNTKNTQGVGELVNSIKIKYFKVFRWYLLSLCLLAFIAPIPFIEKLDYRFMVLIFLVMGLKTYLGLFMSRYNIMFTVDQKAYIPSIISNFEVIINLILFIVLARLGVNFVLILAIDLLITMISKIIIYMIYIKSYRHFHMVEGYYPIEDMDTTPMYFHALTGVIVSQTDSVIITNLIGLAASTTFGIYNTVFSSLRQLVLPFVNVFNPGLASLYHESKERFNSVFSTFITWCFLIGTSISAALIISYDYFLYIWLSHNAVIVSFLAIGLSFFLYTAIVISPINALNNLFGNYRETLKFTILEGVLNVVLSLLLLSKFGIVGVIISTVITSFLNIGLRLVFVFNKLHPGLTMTYLRMVSISLVVMVANIVILNMLPDTVNFLTWVLYTLLAFVINFTVLVLIYKVVCRQEMDMILNKLFSFMKKTKIQA